MSHFLLKESSLYKLLSRSLYKREKITNTHWCGIYCRDKQSGLAVRALTPHKFLKVEEDNI